MPDCHRCPISTTRSYQPLNCLIAWFTGKRVEQFVGQHDDGPVRHLVEGLVPHHRHVERGHRLLLPLLQRRADLDQMQHDRRKSTLCAVACASRKARCSAMPRRGRCRRPAPRGPGRSSTRSIACTAGSSAIAWSSDWSLTIRRNGGSSCAARPASTTASSRECGRRWAAARRSAGFGRARRPGPVAGACGGYSSLSAEARTRAISSLVEWGLT